MKSNSEFFLKPTLLLAEALGLYPFTRPDHRITVSSTIVVLLFAFYLGYYNFMKIFWNTRPFQRLIHHLMSFYDILKLVSLLSMVISPFIYRADMSVYWDVLQKAEMLLYELNISQPSYQTRKMQLAKICSMVFFCFSMFIFSAWRFGSIFHLFSMFSARLCVLNILFIGIMSELCNKLQHFNWHLTDLSSRFPEFLIPPANPRHPFNEFSCVAYKRKHFIINSSNLNPTRITSIRIRKLNRVHKYLSDAIDAFNQIFGLQVCTCLTLVVCNFLIGSSSLIAIIVTQKQILNQYYSHHLSKELKYSVYLCLRAFFFMSGAIIAIKTCDTLKREARRAGSLVHEIMEDDHPEDVDKELDLFSSLLLHRSPHVDAFGFFQVDYKILLSIVSVIAPGVIFFAEVISNNYMERIRESYNNSTMSN